MIESELAVHRLDVGVDPFPVLVQPARPILEHGLGVLSQATHEPVVLLEHGAGVVAQLLVLPACPDGIEAGASGRPRQVSSLPADAVRSGGTVVESVPLLVGQLDTWSPAILARHAAALLSGLLAVVRAALLQARRGPASSAAPALGFTGSVAAG